MSFFFLISNVIKLSTESTENAVKPKEENQHPRNGCTEGKSSRQPFGGCPPKAPSCISTHLLHTQPLSPTVGQTPTSVRALGTQGQLMGLMSCGEQLRKYQMCKRFEGNIQGDVVSPAESEVGQVLPQEDQAETGVGVAS